MTCALRLSCVWVNAARTRAARVQFAQSQDLKVDGLRPHNGRSCPATRHSLIASGSSPTRIGGCAQQHPPCEWPGCAGAATHRAPKGRDRENEYWRFCLDHVREYNHSYNFFAGMSTDDIARYQREAVVGHRPTWKMGMNGGKPTGRSRAARFGPAFEGTDDPFELFGDGAERRASAPPRDPRHPQRRAQGARHARPRRRGDDRADQGPFQGTGEAPPSRRQWRRPLQRGPAARDHPGLQLPEVGRLQVARPNDRPPRRSRARCRAPATRRSRR